MQYYIFCFLTGKLSVDNAMLKAYGMGIASVPYEDMDHENEPHKKAGEVYKFWNL